MNARLRRFLGIAATVLAWSVARADSSDPSIDEPVPVPEAELLQITLSLLQVHPELASSPGVKAATVYAGGPGPTDGASVIFYPHSESRGIKEAFQVYCQREHTSPTWTCNDVTIRRYIRLASQDFEVRVTDGISAEAALALIEASRRDMHANVTDVADLPSTAILIMPHVDRSCLVDWGSAEGYYQLTMLARLEEGGDPANSDAWHATRFEFPGASGESKAPDAPARK